MGRKCGVKDCLSDAQRKEDIGVTFHKVPHHADIRPKWLQLCRITNGKKCIYVCSRHFLRADFCNFKGRKYMLKQGVLPSIFPWNKPASTQSKCDVKEEKEDEEVVIKTESESEPTVKSINEVIESSYMQPLHIKTEVVEVKEEMKSPVNLSTIEQKVTAMNSSTGELGFVPNARIEALDFNQTWRPATILEVDYEENEVLVHFDMYSSKYDEWIGINSNSIRPVAQVEKKEAEVEETFAEGERCMASWSDARKFPATITKVIDTNTYEVLFDDGYVKTLKSRRISKCSSTSPQCSPLFQPVSGTKEDRRTKKRKLDVTNLFNKKRPKVENPESGAEVKMEVVSEDTADSKAKTDVPEEWYPTWENNRPVGVDSFVLMMDGHLKSVIVADPRLPPKWEKHVAQKVYEHAAGKWGIIIVSPEGRKFRQKCDIRQYIKENPHLNLSESMFEFVLHKKRKKARPQTPPAELPAPELTDKEPEQEPPPVSENKSKTLKIKWIDGGYKCPIEGCGKNFRRENLAQMHVKHYHPEFTKFLDSTPNVADLAYARTVVGEVSKSPGSSGFNSEKASREPRPSKPKPAPQKTFKPDPLESLSETQKDSEILKLLNSKPFDSISKIESSSIQPLPSGLPPSMYPDIKLKDLLVKSEAVPKNNDINLKSLSSATTRPTGLKTLLPVKKEDPDLKSTPSKPPKKDLKRKRLVSEVVEMQRNKEAIIKAELPPPPVEIKSENAPTEQADNIIIEGGEVIKIVQMRQEEIINCTCGVTEEDGLMIQCELCFCWQHAYCNNIQKEIEVPEKYVCYICQHPAKQRESMKYMHDQDWLKYGTLPSCSFRARDEEAEKELFEKLKISHDISGGLVELQDYVHSLKLKIKIAEVKNHPKLYLWSKPWDKPPLPELKETQPEEMDIKDSIKSEDAQTESMLMTILKVAKEEIKIKEELPEFPKLDINTLIENNIGSIVPPAPNIPQPEAAIESADCRLNLLEHILHSQQLVDQRLSMFEKQLKDLDPSLFEENEDQFVKAKLVTSMVVRDLNTMKELADLPAT